MPVSAFDPAVRMALAPFSRRNRAVKEILLKGFASPNNFYYKGIRVQMQDFIADFIDVPSIIIKRTETQTSRLCVFSLLQPHRTEVRLTGKYRYLTFEDRKKIEAWHLLGDRPVDIAARLSVHHTTIYKELQRGATGALDANQREGYSAELAERRLRESFKRRGKRAPAAQ